MVQRPARRLFSQHRLFGIAFGRPEHATTMRACTATALSTPLLLLAAALAVASSASASSPELRLLEWLRAQRGAVVVRTAAAVSRYPW